MIVNNDGSKTIAEPYFRVSGGKLRISATASDLDGVCKRYGFGAAQMPITWSEWKPSPSDPSARIKNDDWKKNTPLLSLAYPFILVPAEFPSLTEYKKIYFNSRQSDPDGVCKYFGYGRAAVSQIDCAAL